MDKRKKPGQRKVKIAYTPAADWDIRLKRVFDLLLRTCQAEKDKSGEGGEHDKRSLP